MSQEAPNVAVVFHGEKMQQTPKATFFDWIKYYFYNLSRKPAVWKKKKELERIALEVKASLETEVLSQLIVNAKMCVECRNAYMALRPQIFVSQIKMILKMMECSEHGNIYYSFRMKYNNRFEASEDISAWINGFKK